MPVVTIQLWAGRSPELKAKMAKAVTDALQESANVPPALTTVIFQEISKDNWSEAGVMADSPEFANRPR
jgi:4-oxalocrotonate tautomerase